MDAPGPTGKREEEKIVVPVVEEELTVHKRAVEKGRMRVHKTVHEREQTVEEPVFSEDVDVVRVPVGRQVDGPVPVRYEGDTMIVPLLEEVLVVEKRLVLREELRITRRRSQVNEVRRGTVRAEEATIERLPAEPAGGLKDDRDIS